VLAAPSDGALTEIKVRLHQSVAVGDVIAGFDNDVLNARRNVLVAQIEALMEAQAADRKGRARLFERDREEAGLELGELVAGAQESEARLNALRERLTIDERLFEQGVAPEEQALAVRREIRVVETRLTADRERLDLARKSATLAARRAATAPGRNEWQIEAARRELGEIEKKIERLTLRTSIAGQITQIYRYPGDWLRAGEQVLRISPESATEVHAWLDSSAAAQRSGLSARIRRSSGKRLVGRVQSVGVERLQKPNSIWARSDAPEWGYLMRIEVAEGVLGPGEPVSVGLLPTRGGERVVPSF